MKVFKTKSLDAKVTDEQLEQEWNTVSFFSFKSAIENTLSLGGRNSITEVKGYRITEDGIEIIWK